MTSYYELLNKVQLLQTILELNYPPDNKKKSSINIANMEKEIEKLRREEYPSDKSNSILYLN